MNSAYKSYHSLECKFDDQINPPLRFLFEALSAFDGKIDLLKDFIELKGDKEKFLLDFDWSDPFARDVPKNQLMVMHSLSRSKLSAKEVDTLLRRVKNCATDKKSTKKIWRQHEDFIDSLLKRFMEICIHQEQLDVTKVFTPGQVGEFVGKSIYPLLECFKSSSYPNIKKTPVAGNKLKLSVTRKVKAGSEILLLAAEASRI